MKSIWVFIWLIMIGAGPGMAAVETVDCDSPRLLMNFVDSEGGKKVIRAIDANGEQEDKCWNKILDHIGTGDSKWLEFAGRIAPFTDAMYSETLYQVALPRALTHSPEQVLRIFGNKNLKFFCTADPNPFHDERNQQQIAREVGERLQNLKTALETVQSPELLEVKRKCLKIINERADRLLSAH